MHGIRQFDENTNQGTRMGNQSWTNKQHGHGEGLHDEA